MGWEDRPYYRDRPHTGGNQVLRLISGSVPLFTAFGIRVRVHASLIFFIVVTLLFSEAKGEMGIRSAATSMAILFVSVLLHEFGHCFGCRWVGGEAEDILMWPLGGLAMINPPRRPWPSFISTAAGPAVNVVLCVVTLVGVYIAGGSGVHIPWFPFRSGLTIYIPPGHNLVFYLWWIFIVNYGLLAFNLCLLFYPFDGGRMVQELLWLKVGYYRSMLFATAFGMPAACVVAAIGIVYFSWLLVAIAAMGFYACYRQRQAILSIGPEEFADETDYIAAYEINPPKKKARRNTRAARRARAIALEHRSEQTRLDAILKKVSATGMASLTWSEKRTLKKATESRRRHDTVL